MWGGAPDICVITVGHSKTISSVPPRCWATRPEEACKIFLASVSPWVVARAARSETQVGFVLHKVLSVMLWKVSWGFKPPCNDIDTVLMILRLRAGHPGIRIQYATLVQPA